MSNNAATASTAPISWGPVTFTEGLTLNAFHWLAKHEIHDHAAKAAAPAPAPCADQPTCPTSGATTWCACGEESP